MVTSTAELLESVADELHLSQDALINEGVRAVLSQRLQVLNSRIRELHGKYEVNSVEEMQARYEVGTLEEEDSWRDLQDLDHLEYKRDRLVQLLGHVQ
jgi:hypothetical protein